MMDTSIHPNATGNNVVPFTFEPTGTSVRALEIDGEPWFVARDVAETLGYAKPENAIAAHCKGVTETVTPSAGGPQRTKIIPERDVYRLIMRSKLPAAERFEDWVVGEVLPTIRKTGGYTAPGAQVGPSAEQLVEAMRPLIEEVVEARIAKDPRVAARDYLSARDVLDRQRVPSQGRGGLVRKASHRLVNYSLARDHHVTFCDRTGTRLFKREAVTAWLRDEGDALIRDHLDTARGQQRLRLVH
jgi:prophage antirepressor-like protein